MTSVTGEVGETGAGLARPACSAYHHLIETFIMFLEGHCKPLLENGKIENTGRTSYGRTSKTETRKRTNPHSFL